MIRFIDLGNQIGMDYQATDEEKALWPRTFAFYDPIRRDFLNFNGFSVWRTWDGLERDFKLDYAEDALLATLKNLCPEWVLTTQQIGDKQQHGNESAATATQPGDHPASGGGSQTVSREDIPSSPFD